MFKQCAKCKKLISNENDKYCTKCGAEFAVYPPYSRLIYFSYFIPFFFIPLIMTDKLDNKFARFHITRGCLFTLCELIGLVPSFIATFIPNTFLSIILNYISTTISLLFFVLSIDGIIKIHKGDTKEYVLIEKLKNLFQKKINSIIDSILSGI